MQMSTDPEDTAVEDEEFFDDELDPDAYLHPDDELQAYGEERFPLIAGLLQLAGGAGYFYADRPGLEVLESELEAIKARLRALEDSSVP